MSSILLLALLGITFLWPPRVQTLKCQVGNYESVKNRSEQFFSWTTGNTDCPYNQPACQDTLLFIENGPLMKVVVLKGCTSAPLQEKNVIKHRTDPSISFLSYTRVCNMDLCNDLSSTLPLWEQVPPSASIHPELRIQGCQAQPGCDLLNGTEEVGPLSLKEVCEPNELLTCHRGNLMAQNSFHIAWETSDTVLCSKGEVCQETLLLIASVTSMIFVGSKGCTKPKTQLSQSVQVHMRSSGVLIASYSHFCNNSGCNDASSSSVLLDQVPISDPSASNEAPGNMGCPDCVSIFGLCSERSKHVKCPKSSSHCYHGLLKVIRGKSKWDISVQGCADQPSQNLLNTDLYLGPFRVTEITKDKEDDTRDEENIISKAAPIHSVAWVIWLALPIALWQGGPSSP